MSTGYRTFAFAGVGNLGTYFVEAFLDAKAAGDVGDVLVLVRLVRIFLVARNIYLSWIPHLGLRRETGHLCARHTRCLCPLCRLCLP